MRSLRPLLACLAISLTIIAACGSPAASGGGPTATTGQGDATASAPGEPTTPPATTGGGGGGGGGGANGSATYQISGGYTASGELPFVPQVSTFSNGGWVATFANETTQELIQINTVGGNLVVGFGDGKIAIAATATIGCTINMTKNDASGLAGNYDCSGNVAVDDTSGAQLNVVFKGAFAGHP